MAVRKRGTPPAKRGRKPGNKAQGKRGTAPGPLTPAGLTSTNGHIESMGEARRTQRTKQALDWLDQGLTYEQIGSRLGVSGKTICLDLATWHERAGAEIVEKIEHRRLREERKSLLRDRAVMPLLYGKVQGRRRIVGTGRRAKVVEDPPDPATVVTAITRAHQRLEGSGKFRAELYGLNAPQKLALTDPTGTRRYHEMSDEELEGENRRLRGLLGEVIDVTPGRNGDGTPEA